MHKGYNFNLGLQGAVGERIIKGLLTRSGFKVRSYGVEFLAPELSSWELPESKCEEEFVKGEELTKKLVQRLPDFVVHNDKSEVFFVEAKYTSQSINKYNLKGFLFPKAYILVVNPFDIYLIHGSDTTKNYSLLNDREEIKDKLVNVTHYGEQEYKARLDPFGISEELIKEALDELRRFIEELRKVAYPVKETEEA